MLPLIDELQKKGVLCGLCTNNEKYRTEYLKEKFRLDKIFDFIVTSYETGVRKPEKKMFDKVLEVTGLSAESVLVCDDKEKNIEILGSWGFTPHVYKTQEDFEEELRDLEIL